MTKRRKVWMVGAGDLARELYGWIHCDGGDARYEVVGFIDDNKNIDLEKYHIYRPLVSPEDLGSEIRGTGIIMGVSSPGAKRSLTARLLAAGAVPVTYIHPTVLVGRDVVIGDGTVISPRTVICSHSTVGEWCTINAFCEVGHEVSLGDFTTLLGHNALNGRVVLGTDCFVGCGAVFHPKVKIGDGTTVGIGSVVLNNVSPGVTVFGNPAKKISPPVSPAATASG